MKYASLTDTGSNPSQLKHLTQEEAEELLNSDLNKEFGDLKEAQQYFKNDEFTSQETRDFVLSLTSAVIISYDSTFDLYIY